MERIEKATLNLLNEYCKILKSKDLKMIQINVMDKVVGGIYDGWGSMISCPLSIIENVYKFNILKFVTIGNYKGAIEEMYPLMFQYTYNLDHPDQEIINHAHKLNEYYIDLCASHDVTINDYGEETYDNFLKALDRAQKKLSK